MNAPKDRSVYGPPNHKRRIDRLLLAVVAVMLFGSPVLAQGDDGLQLAPPPLKLMSEQEKARLNSARNHRDRTKLVLDLMRDRITAAEKRDEADDYAGMFTELGAFHALMDDGLGYLQKLDQDDRKVLDTFKRLEIGLRQFPSRLEAMRRDLPLKYEDYVRRLIRYLRQARTIATEPLFGDTVIPENAKDSNEAPNL